MHMRRIEIMPGMSVYMYIHRCICIYLCICVCVCVCVYTHTHTHTHSHTHTLAAMGRFAAYPEVQIQGFKALINMGKDNEVLFFFSGS
jgi:hypothetical protein